MMMDESSKAAVVEQQQQQLIPYLPPEIISEFLVRLPVRILCTKLRYVSKQWYALVADPVFRSFYRSRSKQNPPRILIIQRNDPVGRTVFSSLDKDRKLDPIGRFKVAKEYLCAFPCLDLVCLYDCVSMYIWNPSTAEHIKLPEYRSETKHSCYRQEVAFGYLASAAKYKILHIRTDFSSLADVVCELLTLGGGSSHKQWKVTDRPPYGLYHHGAAAFRGAFYLLRMIDRGIARFDLEREEWTWIEGPKPEDLRADDNDPATLLTVMELGGSLCLTDYHMHLGTAIWFLEEDYDKGISLWVCKYNIDVSPILCAAAADAAKVVVPLLIEKDGKVLLHIRWTNTLYYYEPKSKSFEAIYFYSGRGWISPCVYIESFKSLKF